jgi:hypothetical protein
MSRITRRSLIRQGTALRFHRMNELHGWNLVSSVVRVLRLNTCTKGGVSPAMDEAGRPMGRLGNKIRKGWKAVLGSVVALAVVAAVILAVVAYRPSYVQPPITVTNQSVSEQVTWNATDTNPLSVGPFLAFSQVAVNDTNLTSSFKLQVSISAAQTPAGIQYVIYSLINGNISPDLRPAALTSILSDYPGNYSSVVLRAIVEGFSGQAYSRNISYPEPLGYTGVGSFTGRGTLTPTVGLANVSAKSRYFFTYPAWADLWIAYPANNTTIFNTFHIAAELGGLSPSVICEISVNVSDHFSGSKWG